MLLTTPIETSRLILRTLEAADVGETYTAWLRDPEVVRYLEVRFLPHQDVSQVQTFVASANASRSELLVGIFPKEAGRHIGNIKLGPVIREHARAPIGYMIGDRASWGRGYASEGIRALAQYALEHLGVEKVTAGCYETNFGSSKALLKAGFTFEASIPSDVICEGKRLASLYYAMYRSGCRSQ